jgi:AcrR family transcriptional regulator
MTPRTATQFEEIRYEKKKLIIEVALNLFANDGYHATSISKIAKAAAISKGLLYNYFESKEALLKEIIKEASDKLFKYFDPNRDGILTHDEFLFFIRQSIRIVKENLDYWKLYSSLLLQSNVSDLLENEFKNISTEYSKMLLEFFIKSGCKDPLWELMMFAAHLKGAMIEYISGPKLYPLDLFEKKLINFYNDRLKSD